MRFLPNKESDTVDFDNSNRRQLTESVAVLQPKLTSPGFTPYVCCDVNLNNSNLLVTRSNCSPFKVEAPYGFTLDNLDFEKVSTLSALLRC